MTADSSSTLELLTIADVAEMLKISATGVRRMLLTRQLPFIKVGGSVRFAKSDIVDYLKRRHVDSMH